jgi:alkyl hydroperoxide reductase subunit AhpC
MPLSTITPLPVGSIAPDFALIEVVSGQSVSLGALLERAELWEEQGVTLVMIACNAGETIEQMRDMADAYGITNPILLDEGNVVTDAYGAQTTPHVFVLDSTGRVIYQGAVDDRTFRQPEPTINYLDAAVEALITGQRLTISDTPAYGCQIVRQGL